MPINTFSDGQVITAAGHNENWALAVLTDTTRTITVSHTWSAAQTLTAGYTLGASAIAVTGNSAGMNVAGTLGLAGTAAIANAVIGYSTTFTVSSGAYYGLSSSMQFGKTSAAFTGYAIGVVAHGSLDSTNTQDWTGDGVHLPLSGLWGQVDTEVGATGTVSEAASLNAVANFNGGTITKWSGLKIQAPTVSAPGVVTNAYGIYIDSITQGGTLNYAIYTNSGTVRFGGLVDAAAGQIKFPATANPSADANTFDGYQESTFTPALNFGGATTGITYSAQTGVMTKKAREVTLTIRFTLTSKGSATGAATITGLPETVSGAGSCSVGYYDGLSGAGMVVGLATGTSIALRYAAATTCTALADTNFTNASEMFLTVTYNI